MSGWESSEEIKSDETKNDENSQCCLDHSVQETERNIFEAFHKGIDARRSSLTVAQSGESLTSRVLVVYTGGTIGMEDDSGVLVPSTKPLIDKIRQNPLLCDQQYEISKSEDTKVLALPKVKSMRRVLYKVLEYSPLLDSSNMCKEDWVKISNDIKMNYEMFDGFVILHGTDTLSYTASALSFMLENLGKPVIVTGSQISIFQIRSDGVYNFIGSLILAGNYDIPEVTVFFNNKLLRANRTVKMSVNEFDAFDSPNFQPLVKVGLTIDVNSKLVFRSSTIEKFSVESRLNENVGILRMYPNISNQTMKCFLQSPMEGVILQTYGSGNIPTNRKDLIAELKIACERGVVIVNCSQCSRGGTSQAYETGKILADIGVMNGFDMTSEAALTKLSYVLSKSDCSLEMKKDMMTTNMRGEISTDLTHAEKFDLASAVATNLHISGYEEVNKLRNILFPAMLHSAVYEDDIDKIKEIENYGADISMTDFDGRTILHTACSAGKINVVQYCLRSGVNVHIRDRYDINALHEAVIADQHVIIKILRQSGAHLTNEPTFLGDVLTNAAARGMITRLKSYLLAGVSLNQSDSIGLTPLHAAVQNNELNTVRFLLVENVDVRNANKFGQNALDLAKQMSFQEVIDLIQAFEVKDKKVL